MVPGQGPPPQQPRLLGRVDRPMTNAVEGGVNHYHASPFANPIGGRHVRGAAMLASDGYGPAPVPKSFGSPLAVVRGQAPVERFKNGSPMFAEDGFGPAPRPSGGASAPSILPGAPMSRFVNSSPAPGGGPAGRFI